MLALDGLSLSVARGEVVALLGPSGSGKTTLLHAAAGFVAPSSGTIHIGEREVSRPGWVLAPEKRSVGLVFQSYALWPHLTAVETVAYPLRRRGVARNEALSEARTWLDKMGMASLASRKPAQMSGGEQQRVGLARALASAPALFLFDEPTANLDASLKGALQTEIGCQQRGTGAGAIYVTHDPAEAFAIADRVAVIRGGRLVQTGDPVSIYSAPVDPWVAALTGPSSTLPVDAARTAGDDRLALRLLGKDVVCSGLLLSDAGGTLAAVLRPEWAALGSAGTLAFDGCIRLVRFQGAHTDYSIDSAARQVLVRVAGAPAYAIDEAVSWEPRRLVVVPAQA